MILIARAPPDMCFTVRVKIEPLRPEPGKAGLKAVCICRSRPGGGPRSAGFRPVCLVPATAKPVAASTAAAIPRTTRLAYAHDRHPSPASPCPPKPLKRLFTLVSLPRGDGEQAKDSLTKLPPTSSRMRWTRCARRSANAHRRARSSPPGSPRRNRNRRGSESRPSTPPRHLRRI